ncbi:MAG: anhydro-N-acetylmuramic acid kinase [Bacteroidetes bacterium]|nr:anhydro-N-acetylmuramic acid kinase [Bacteroidota bacterium]
MVYRVIGLMSGSSLDGLDIAYVQLTEIGGKWSYEIKAADCYGYDAVWKQKLRSAIDLSAREYQVLHVDYGHFLGSQVNRFINELGLQYQVQLIASHGHTTFHNPGKRMTAQLGDGAAIAAETGIPVISDLRSMDIALGGQGAPVVPIGEKCLFPGYAYFLNIGGIANITHKQNENFIAFDICPANSVLNQLAGELGKEFDTCGVMASSGKINEPLLKKLNEQNYYKLSYPKSLSNSFGKDIIYPIVKAAGCSPIDALRTYVEHINHQIENAIQSLMGANENIQTGGDHQQMLVTGGGGFNLFLIEQLKSRLSKSGIEVVVPEENLVKYKEAIVMALMGVLRWREENNVMASVTGARRSSIGGAIWMGANP